MLLDVANLTTAYRGLIAISDISIQVADGEIVTVAGANGAGKSTLLKTTLVWNAPAPVPSPSTAPASTRCGLPLAAGDDVPLTLEDATGLTERTMQPLPMPGDVRLRVVPGPQDDYFTQAGWQTFFNSAYAVTSQADRMGVRLTGPRIEHAKGFNIISDGIVAGSVQIPGSGEPIVMLADRQTTGGYPKIATVITPDLRLLAQRRPRESIRFAVVSIEEAQQIARAASMDMAALPRRCRPIRRGLPGSDALLAMNLAGSAVSARDPTTW